MHIGQQLSQLFSTSPAVIFVQKNMLSGEWSTDEVIQELGVQLAPNQTPSSILSDVTTLEIQERGTVDDIRGILSNSYMRPYTLPYRLVVIVINAPFREQVQQLFLKAIEDATQYQRFLFITQNEYELLPTIRSRSVILTEEASAEEPQLHDDLIHSFITGTPLQRKALFDSELQVYTKSSATLLEYIQKVEKQVAQLPRNNDRTEFLAAIEKCRTFCHTSTQKNLIVHSLIFIPTMTSL